MRRVIKTEVINCTIDRFDEAFKKWLNSMNCLPEEDRFEFVSCDHFVYNPPLSSSQCVHCIILYYVNERSEETS